MVNSTIVLLVCASPAATSQLPCKISFLWRAYSNRLLAVRIGGLDDYCRAGSSGAPLNSTISAVTTILGMENRIRYKLDLSLV